MSQEERREGRKKKTKGFWRRGEAVRVASLEAGEARTECYRPSPGRPPNDHGRVRGMSWVSAFAPSSSQHPLVWVSEPIAFRRLEGRSFGCLTKPTSCGGRTGVLFSGWSSAEHHCHFLEESTFLKVGTHSSLFKATRGGLSPCHVSNLSSSFFYLISLTQLQKLCFFFYF